MKRLLFIALTAGLFAVPSVQAQETVNQVAVITSAITTDNEKAGAFVGFMLKHMGDSSGVGDCSVFVKKTVGKTDYLVAKVVLSDQSNVQEIWRAVLPMDLSNISIVPENVWQLILKTGDDKPLQGRKLDPNS